jgi:hypothetical protein
LLSDQRFYLVDYFERHDGIQESDDGRIQTRGRPSSRPDYFPLGSCRGEGMVANDARRIDAETWNTPRAIKMRSE